ncbi:hypothetical protein CAEBREN_00031 [Caenorhabditis brenneri]|uniref:Tyrosine-protein phosphatase domain-containing protein n=1 Tax=Caenorhabditis brenneri TaxID=135651 RepID=G0N670_CAEBE|nr:hypothetical protein CAEBREN_00031 [Caenorhabditis brenneri]
MNALRTLETLDLDFEKFKIKDAIPSLIAMDRFFEKYFAYFSGSIQISEPGNSLTTSFPGQIVETAPMDRLEEDTLDKRRILVTLIGICVGVCFVVTTVTFGIWCWKCKPKKSAAPSKSSKFALVTYPKAPGDAPEVPKCFDDTRESSKMIHVIKELIRMHHCDDDLKNQLHRGISPENRTYGLHESFWIPRKSEKWYEAGSIDKPEDELDKTRKLISCHIRSTVETHKCNKEFIEDKLLYVGRHPSDDTEKEQDETRKEQWSMGSDNDVLVIVLLCDEEEKSAEYFPTSVGKNQDNGMKCGSFSVIARAFTTDTDSIQTKKLDFMECVEWSANWNQQQATKYEDPRKCEDSEEEKEKSGGKNAENRSVKISVTTKSMHSSVSGIQLQLSQQMRRWKEGGGEKK